MKFGEKLLNLRKINGMSQEELADKLNVTRQTISKWELDQTVPDMNKLIDISKIFNISIDELTGGIKMNEYQNEYTNEYKETIHEKKNTKIALKVFLIGTILSLIICGIGLFKQISAKNTEEKAKQDAIKLSEQRVEQAKASLQNLQKEYDEVKAQYDAKVEECNKINMLDDGWMKCNNEQTELSTKKTNIELSITTIKNADYTAYYQLADPTSYTTFYWIGAGTFGVFTIISLIFYLATRKK